MTYIGMILGLIAFSYPAESADRHFLVVLATIWIVGGSLAREIRAARK